MKRNDGFTLVELLCAIVAGSIVTAATATILLLGLRMNANANNMATKDNQAVICLSVMEEMIKNTNVVGTTNNGKQITAKDESNQDITLFKFESNKIVASSNAVLLDEVYKCEFLIDSGLLTIKLTLNEGDEPFVKTIRLVTGQTITLS